MKTIALPKVKNRASYINQKASATEMEPSHNLLQDSSIDDIFNACYRQSMMNEALQNDLTPHTKLRHEKNKQNIRFCQVIYSYIDDPMRVGISPRRSSGGRDCSCSRRIVQCGVWQERISGRNRGDVQALSPGYYRLL